MVLSLDLSQSLSELYPNLYPKPKPKPNPNPNPNPDLLELVKSKSTVEVSFEVLRVSFDGLKKEKKKKKV